jgi:PilZ domain
MGTMPDTERLTCVEDDDRRDHTRYDAFLAVQIDSNDKPGRLGVCQNLSSAGMLIATPSRFRVGERVDVTFRVSRIGAKRRRVGTVRRLYDVAGRDFAGRLAIEFERLDPGLEPLLRRAARP